MKRLQIVIVMSCLIIFYQNFTLGTSNGEMSTIPNICEIKPGKTNCTVQLMWNADVSSGEQACVFIKESQKKIGCGQEGLTQLSWISKEPKTLELKKGDGTYSKSQVLTSMQVFGIQKISGDHIAVSKKIDTRLKKIMINKRAAAMTGSWDGRLFFEHVGFLDGKTGTAVKVFRPEAFRKDLTYEQNIENENTFSPSFWVESDSLTPQQIEEAKALNNVKKIEGPNFGKNLNKLNTSSHLAVYPIDLEQGNPFPSNSNGQFSSNGEFLTYAMYGISAATKAPNGKSRYRLKPGTDDTEMKHFLVKYPLTVVVEKPYTPEAKVKTVKVGVGNGLLNTKGGFLYGYEPSVTLDGRLIVFSGNPRPSSLDGNGGHIQYSYRMGSSQFYKHTPTRNIAKIYFDHGPGRRGGERKINGVPFSEHYPIAKKRLKTFDGKSVPWNSWIKGGYPWVSLTGSEVFYQSISGFHGAARFGAAIVGQRTHYTIQLMDGQVNQSRGNPTDDFNLFTSTDEGKALEDAYKNLITKNQRESSGKGYQQVLYAPVAQNGTSWSPFVNTPMEKKFPMSPFSESYSFFLTGGRYFEFPFPEFPRDLLVHMSMQEPLVYDFKAIRERINGTSELSTNEYRAIAAKYSNYKVADHSGHFQTGTLRHGAYYPFEFYRVKKAWNQANPSLRDFNDGAIGNSLIFRPNGLMTFPLKKENVDRIKKNKAYTLSFWMRKNRVQSTGSIINIPGLFLLWWNSNKIDMRIATSKNTSETSRAIIPVSIRNNQWAHFAISMGPNGIGAVYIDGKPVHSINEGGNYFSNVNNAIQVRVGPGNTGSRNSILSFDDLHLYSAQLSDDEILKLAWRQKRIRVGRHSLYDMANLDKRFGSNIEDEKWGFKINYNRARVGQVLFVDRRLSSNGKVSCASCHRPDRFLASSNKVDIGVSGKALGRNTPSIWNAGFQKSMMWDGSIASVETQVLHPVIHPDEMGTKAQDIVQHLKSVPYYNDSIKKLYGRAPDLSIAADLLSQFVKSRITWPNADDQNRLSNTAKKGKRLFEGKANCVGCHSGPFYTDHRFYDVGLGEEKDPGRSLASGKLSEEAGFKTQGLRGISKTAPYFHNGQVATLREVVEQYNKGKPNHPSVDPRLRPLRLTPGQVNALVEYLKSL